jgi:hypothetical protein
VQPKVQPGASTAVRVHRALRDTAAAAAGPGGDADGGDGAGGGGGAAYGASIRERKASV